MRIDLVHTPNTRVCKRRRGKVLLLNHQGKNPRSAKASTVVRYCLPESAEHPKNQHPNAAHIGLGHERNLETYPTKAKCARPKTGLYHAMQGTARPRPARPEKEKKTRRDLIRPVHAWVSTMQPLTRSALIYCTVGFRSNISHNLCLEVVAVVRLVVHALPRIDGLAHHGRTFVTASISTRA